MSTSLFVQITALLQSVNGPDGTPQTEVFLNVCRHIIPVIGAKAVKHGLQDYKDVYLDLASHCREVWYQLPHSQK